LSPDVRWAARGRGCHRGVVCVAGGAGRGHSRAARLAQADARREGHAQAEQAPPRAQRLHAEDRGGRADLRGARRWSAAHLRASQRAAALATLLSVLGGLMLRVERRVREGTPTDVLSLPYDERKKSRLRARAESGREVAIVLERGSSLRHGDLLAADSGEIL